MAENISIIKAACFGCKACEQVCPNNSIFFKDNGEGFSYPVVKETCIHCGLCLKCCPADEQKSVNNSEEKQYYGFSATDDYKIDSASGGFSTFLSKAVLEKKGIVCGCALVDNVATHIFVDDPQDLHKIQSSKYVQSDTSLVYSQVKKYLNEDRLVLFTGTPCQVFGLKTFLKKDYPNLLTADLVCHGVPSPKLFENYIKYLERKEKSKISNYNFRYKKKKGWGTYYYYYCDDTRKERTNMLGVDKYGHDFYKALNYRECCYNCKFANVSCRPGDFSMGDFWDILKAKPEKYDGLGVSSIIINTAKAKDFINPLLDENFFEVNKEDVISGQRNLKRATSRPTERDNYYNNFDDKFFDRKQTPLCIKSRIKALVPKSLKNFIKKHR